MSDDGTCTVYVRPPEAATYLLQFYGRGQGDDDQDSTLHHLLSYVIRFSKPHPDKQPFPDKSGLWGLKPPIALDCGLKKTQDMAFEFKAKNGEVKIPLALSRYTELKAKLTHARNKDENLAEFTVIEYTEDGATITARLPEPGYYMLTVHASPPETTSQPPEATKLKHVADFLLHADTACPDKEPYPGKSVLLGLKHPAATDYGVQPSKGTSFSLLAKHGRVEIPLSLSRDVNLTAKLKHAQSMDKTLGEFTIIEYTEDGAAITVRLPKPGYYLLTVFAGNPEDTDLESVANFLLYADTGCSDQEPYPGKCPRLGLKKPSAADYGIQLTRNMSFSLVAKDGQVTVHLASSKHIELDAKLTHAGNIDGKLGEFTIIEYTEDGAVITARLPKPGYYLLSVFAGHQESRKHEHVADFLLYTDTACPDQEPYPGKSLALGLKKPRAIDYGIKDSKDTTFFLQTQDGQVKVALPLNRWTELSTRLTHSRNMEEELKQFTLIEYTEEAATIHARLPKSGYYALHMLASNPEDLEDRNLRRVATFLLHAELGYSQCKPFPEAYSTPLRVGTTLLQPLVRDVPPGAATLYRLHAPTLAIVTVGGAHIQRNKEGVWEAEVTPEKGKEKVTIFGAADRDAKKLTALYTFTVC